MVVAGKAFLYFVYYKALSVMLFPKSLTVLAAALIAIAATGIDYLVYQNYMRQRLPGAWAFVVVIAGTFFASVVVAYAFSESFWQYSFGSGRGWWGWRSGNYHAYYDRLLDGIFGFFEQNSVRFALTVLPPSIVNFGVFMWAIRR